MYIMHKGKKYSASDAENISFDNSNTSLSATNVQDAICEQNKNITNLTNTAFKGIEGFYFSGTTDSTGDVKMPDEYSYEQGYVVLFAFVWGYNHICLPFHGASPNFCKIININSFNPVNDVNVTGVGYALKIR